jgi:hypothetical protein
MAKVAEGMGRVADDVRAGRRDRAELGAEIKKAAGRRRSEVRSSLESFRTARVRTSREQATAMKAMTKTRHGEVQALLHDLKAARDRARPKAQKAAAALNSERRSDVKEVLNQFGLEQVARHKHRQDVATTFMRNLTRGVAALLDGFDKGNRARARLIRERLGAYALDRHNAEDAWNEPPKKMARDGGASHHPMSDAPPPPAKPAVAEGAAAKAHEPSAAGGHVADRPAHRSGQRTGGHGGSNEPHGGGSK